ncbi:MAG: PilW family protein [Thermoleophilia bacterium]
MRRARAVMGRRRSGGGFTLIELLMGIILASVFAIALFGFFFAGADSARTHESQARAQGDGRTAIDRFAREARQAISPDDGLTSPVISLSPTVVEMYVDPLRTTAAMVPRPEKVRYSIVSGQLIREAAAPVGATFPFTYGSYTRREVLIASVGNTTAAPAFRAFTRTGLALAATPPSNQMRNIAQISVRFLVSQRTGNAATTLELSTDVALRNAVRF